MISPRQRLYQDDDGCTEGGEKDISQHWAQSQIDAGQIILGFNSEPQL